MANHANNLPAKQTTARPTELSEESLSKLLDLTSRETEVRKAEIDLRLHEIQHNSAHAEKILGAQERDRVSERAHELEKTKSKYWFAGFSICLLCVIMLVAMYLGKDALLLELVKLLGAFAAGTFGGYGIGRWRHHSAESDSSA